MKTQLMMDAINYFNANITVSEYDHVYKRGSSYSTLIGDKHSTHDKNYELVCSVAEINELITELSNWQPTLPKVETVEHEGMVYEIGKIYEFRDNDRGWYADVLVAVENGTSFPFESVSTVNRFCRECQSTLGKITPAPTKLIDNNIYTFELNCDLWSGFYRESRGSFFTQLVGGNKICSASEAGQITHLTAAK